MIAFGCALTQPEHYARWAAAGIDRVREPDSAIFPNSSPGSIFRAYNALLDLAGAHEDLEALVLVHQDVEIVDPQFCAKVRAALAEEDVGVVGCVGALDTRSLAWWEGAVTWASFTHHYYEHGGGELPAFAMHPERAAPPAYARTGEVDTIDGFIMVLAPWAVRNLRFDESLGRFHGYDLDFCLQVRAAGRKVMTADLKVVHHHSLQLLADPENWIEANVKLTEKWQEHFPQIGAEVGHRSDDWKARARRAESAASAAHTQRISAQMEADARARELQREIASMSESTSWRVTAPMRRISMWLRRRLGG